MQERKFSKQPEDVQTNSWLELSQKIQLTANTGNIRGMYNGIQKAIEPVQRITSSIKSFTAVILTKKNTNKWKERWDIYPRQNAVFQNALDSLECFQTMDELNSVSSIENLNSAINHLTN